MSKAYDDYLKSPNKCRFCGKEILPKEGQRLYDVKRKNFCDHSCSASYNNSLRNPGHYCLNCGKEIDCEKKFCNHKCHSDYKHNQYIKEWKEGLQTGIIGDYQISTHIRKYLFDKYDSKCCKCGWHEVNPTTQLIPLQIHHIDGNAENNNEDNLELLCPNCHALTPNFGNSNKGNGRSKRYKK